MSNGCGKFMLMTMEENLVFLLRERAGLEFQIRLLCHSRALVFGPGSSAMRQH
jgi:hypothetical protein